VPREFDLAHDNFEFENFSTFSLKQLKNCGNLNKILRNSRKKFIVCKIVGSGLNFYRRKKSAKALNNILILEMLHFYRIIIR
jgi:hypothetical protein